MCARTDCINGIAVEPRAYAGRVVLPYNHHGYRVRACFLEVECMWFRDLLEFH